VFVCVYDVCVYVCMLCYSDKIPTKRRINYVHNVGLISSSSGKEHNMCITDTEKWEVLQTFTGHTRGVYAFQYCKKYRCLLSVGFDRKVCLFVCVYDVLCDVCVMCVCDVCVVCVIFVMCMMCFHV